MMLVSQVPVAAAKNVPKDVTRELFHASKSYAVSRKWWSANGWPKRTGLAANGAGFLECDVTTARPDLKFFWNDWWCQAARLCARKSAYNTRGLQDARVGRWKIFGIANPIMTIILEITKSIQLYKRWREVYIRSAYVQHSHCNFPGPIFLYTHECEHRKCFCSWAVFCDVALYSRAVPESTGSSALKP